jgi:hypothetical protein
VRGGKRTLRGCRRRKENIDKNCVRRKEKIEKKHVIRKEFALLKFLPFCCQTSCRADLPS